MNYDRAVAEALKGNRVMLPHWHWQYISASESKPGKLAIFDEPSGRERFIYRPTHADRKATDWMQAK